MDIATTVQCFELCRIFEMALCIQLVPAVETCAATGVSVENEGLGSLPCRRSVPYPPLGPLHLKVCYLDSRAVAG